MVFIAGLDYILTFSLETCVCLYCVVRCNFPQRQNQKNEKIATGLALSDTVSADST